MLFYCTGGAETRISMRLFALLPRSFYFLSHEHYPLSFSEMQVCGTGVTYLVFHSMHAGNHASSVQGSVMGASKMDNSYVVLSRQNKSQGPRMPPRPPSAAAVHTDPNQSTRVIEGSYIVLPPPAASIYKAPASEGGGAQLTAPGVNSGSPSQGNNSGFHSSVTVLKRAFEIASSQTQVRLI